MGIIGDLNKNGDYVSKHMDKEDLVTALFHVGDPSNGGETKYYTGLTSIIIWTSSKRNIMSAWTIKYRTL